MTAGAPVPTAPVATLDLRDFTTGSPGIRDAFVGALGTSLADTGFVKLTGHDVDPALVEATYAAAEQFFALPLATKDRYAGPRGYTPFGREHAKDNPVGDLKEYWHVGQEQHPADRPGPAATTTEHAGTPAGQSAAPSNQWPAEVPGLARAAWPLYRALESSSLTLLQAIACWLGLPDRSLSDLAVGGSSVLRILHYPPLDAPDASGAPPEAVRAAAHEDINLITVLPAATDDGLELLDRAGTWRTVDGHDGELVVDAGDMLSRFVNLRIPSTTHRVANPADTDRARYSLPFFCHARPEVVLACPAELLAPGEQPHFPPITAQEYLDQRLREIGLA